MVTSTAYRRFSNLLTAEMAKCSAVKMGPYLWAIDGGWFLVAVNINGTKRAGQKYYSLITAIHWLWDEKEHVSFDLNRDETDAVAEDDPNVDEKLSQIISEATKSAQGLVSQISSFSSAYQVAISSSKANQDDPRQLFHKYVLCLLNKSVEQEDVFRTLVQACHGPQLWMQRVLKLAETLHSASDEQLKNMIAGMISTARKMKKLPDVKVVLEEEV